MKNHKKLDFIVGLEEAKKKPVENIYYKIIKEYLGRGGDEVKIDKRGRDGYGRPNLFLDPKKEKEYISFCEFSSAGLYVFSQIYNGEGTNAFLKMCVRSNSNSAVMTFKNNFRRYFNKKLKEIELE